MHDLVKWPDARLGRKLIRFQVHLRKADRAPCFNLRPAVDLPGVSRAHGRDHRSAIVDRARIESLITDGAVTMIEDRLSISDGAEFLVRSVASAFDAHLPHSAATHSRAV